MLKFRGPGFLGFTPNECVKERYSPVENANLTNKLQENGNDEIRYKLVLITNRKSHMGFSIGTKISDLE